MLGAIGLDERQESAYRALVALGAAEVADLAHRLALTETDTECALRRLEQQGLAARSSARTGRWVAAPPGVALGALLTRQRRDLEQAELAAELIAKEYRAEAHEPAVHDLVEVVTGARAVARRCAQLRLAATTELCALVTGDPTALTGAADDADEAGETATTPGVTYRVVLEREMLTAPAGITELTAALGRDEQIRVVDRVPSSLLVADRTLAMVPLAPLTERVRGGEPAVLIVHASGLLDSLLGLFEAVWREALPLRLGGGASASAGDGDGDSAGGGGVLEGAAPGPDATDLEILSLLLAGMTDASVAKQLELGLRTVQRRVKGLMELTGVTTRLQLGWQAHAKGWVARDLRT